VIKIHMKTGTEINFRIIWMRIVILYGIVSHRSSLRGTKS
jgi:hypothetical protein